LDIKLFISSFIDFLRNLFLVKNGVEEEYILEESKEEIEQLKKEAAFFDPEILDEMIRYLINMLENFRYSTQFKVLLEIAFFNLINISNKVSLRFVYDYIQSFGDDPSEKNVKCKGLGKVDPRQKKETPNVKENIVMEKKEMESVSPEKNSTPRQKVLPDIWKKILDIMNQEKPSIAQCLQKGHLEEVKEDSFILSLDHPFFYSNLSKQVKVIEDIIADKLKKKYAIRFEYIKPEKTESQQKKKQIDPVISKAQKIFRGKIINKEGYQ